MTTVKDRDRFVMSSRFAHLTRNLRSNPDAYQDGLLRLLASWDRVGDHNEAMVYTIVANGVNDGHRMAKRHKRDTEDGTFVDRASRSQGYSWVGSAIMAVHPMYRIVALLADDWNMRHHEISNALGLHGPTAVTKILQHVRETLSADPAYAHQLPDRFIALRRDSSGAWVAVATIDAESRDDARRLLARSAGGSELVGSDMITEELPPCPK